MSHIILNIFDVTDEVEAKRNHQHNTEHQQTDDPSNNQQNSQPIDQAHYSFTQKLR